MPRGRRSANQRYHDRVAPRYETVYNDTYWQWHDTLTWDYLKKYLPTDANANVVDLGCGSGKWGRKLLKSGYSVTFVDLSIKMLDETQRQVDETGGSEKASYVQCDLMDLAALPADHFALATAMGEPIGCTSEPAKALQQISRLLKAGGTLVATFDNRIACIDYYLENRDLGALQQFIRTGRTRWLTRDESEQFELHTFEPAQLRKLCERAGLEVIEMLGKTILPIRRHRALLEDPAMRRRLASIEKELAKDPANIARAAHIQIAARKTTQP